MLGAEHFLGIGILFNIYYFIENKQTFRNHISITNSLQSSLLNVIYLKYNIAFISLCD